MSNLNLVSFPLSLTQKHRNVAFFHISEHTRVGAPVLTTKAGMKIQKTLISAAKHRPDGICGSHLTGLRCKELLLLYTFVESGLKGVTLHNHRTLCWYLIKIDLPILLGPGHHAYANTAPRICFPFGGYYWHVSP